MEQEQQEPQQNLEEEEEEEDELSSSCKETTLWKGTTLPRISVRRRCTLTAEGFTTYQPDKPPSSGKHWTLHRRTVLEPASAALIRAHERHLRKAGPLRALSAYARDRNALKLYCFRVEWPDKYAPPHGSSVELGFDTLAAAEEWHAAISGAVHALGGGRNSAGSLTAYGLLANGSAAVRDSHASSAIGGVGASSGGGGGGDAFVDPLLSPFANPLHGSAPGTPRGPLSKQSSLAGASDVHSPSPTPGGGSAGSAGDGGGGGRHQQHHSRHRSTGSSHDPSGSMAAAAAAAAGTAGALLRGGGSSSHAAAAAAAAAAPVGAGGGGARPRSATGSAVGGASPISTTAGTGGGGGGGTGVVVDEAMVRWVPYKHANGMAIYYRQAPQDEAAGGGTGGGGGGSAGGGSSTHAAAGEYMLSTAVQASPECCVANLMVKADDRHGGGSGHGGSGSVLSTAAFMEVLEDNGDMQVWHMVFHPAGSAGLATVLAAPRYTFMHQVLTSYEEGVYAVLFSSVPDEDVKPEWLARARARTQRARRAALRSDPGSLSRRPLWQAPVRCSITGAITLSALEGRSGRDSPQTLVTCIVRADFGGWLGGRGFVAGLGQALGLQEALMDRVLMRVMILKEDVEYSRFKTKPFQLLMVTPEEEDSQQEQQRRQQQQLALQQQQHHASAASLAAAQASLAAAQQHHLEQQLQQAQQAQAQLQQQQQQAQQAQQAQLQAQQAQQQRQPSQSWDGLPPRIATPPLLQQQQLSQPHPPQQQQPKQPSAPGSPRRGGGGGLVPALVAPGSPSAAAAAAAAGVAARVSAAASALAAHMTNPQQLWHEKRGSSSGYGGQPQQGLGGAASPATSPPVSSSGVAPAAAAAATPFATAAAALRQQRSDSGVGSLSSGPRLDTLASTPPGKPGAGGGSGSAQVTTPSGSGFFSVTSSTAPSSGGSATAALTSLASSAAATPAAAANDEFLEASAGDDEGTNAAASNAVVAGVRLPYAEAQLAALIAGTLKRAYWEPIHDGAGSVRDVYSIRGPTYLRDRKKVPAGRGRYRLMAADLVATDAMMDHVGRFLPSVRLSGAAFSFVVDLIINYGSPVLHLVMVFSTDRHPNSLGPCPDDPLDAGDEWTPFDLTMSRFLHGTDDERSGMFKLIPHCAKGSWVVSQSVGTTPVILGRKLATTYHQTERYVEVDVDVASTPAVSYIVKMVQGATRSMLIDHAYLLESQFQHELPETLIGAIRYKHLDMTDYTFLPVDVELPFTPVVPGIVGQ